MDKYYFVDTLPDEVAGNYAGGFVVATIGTKISPNLKPYMSRISGVKQGVVHKARVTADHNVFDNVSWFIDALNGLNRSQWDTLPIIVWLYQSGMNLDMLNTYVGELDKQLDMSHKPLLYVTKAMWDGWMKGSNAEQVALTILSKADIILADYSPSNLEMPMFANKIQWIEAEPGKIYYSEDGYFAFEDPTPDPDPDPEPPQGGGNTDYNVIEVDLKFGWIKIRGYIKLWNAKELYELLLVKKSLDN